jgi:hypothetical protein
MRCAALLKPARCKDMSHSPPVRRLALVLLVLAVRLRRTASHPAIASAASPPAAEPSALRAADSIIASPAQPTAIKAYGRI